MTDHDYLHSHGTEPDGMQGGSISHAIRILRGYLPTILMALLGVMAAYALSIIIFYLASARQEITTQPFRVDFTGAANGRYPNGMKFSAAEIISTPTLLKVFNDNELGRFATFREVPRSIYVLESNRAMELLSAEYQARLTDPKLNPVERAQIQREFEMKRESQSKNEYAVSFYRTGATADIPAPLVKKVLVDVLAAWANRAINERKVLSYRIAMLSPNLMEQTDKFTNQPLVAAQLLRSRILRVLSNIDDLNELPAADLARTKHDRLSLAEIQVRLDEIVRFRVDPLVSAIVNESRSDGRALQFMNDQLAYDQRMLKASQDRAAAIREALAVYTNGAGKLPFGEPAEGQRRVPGGSSETVMPQLSDSFLDRIVALANNAGDMEYRQKLVADYRKATEEVVPIEQAVAYDRAVLEQLRSGSRAPAVKAEGVSAETAAIRRDVETLVIAVNEIYRELSANLNPSTELYSLTGIATTRNARSFSFGRTAATGILILLLAVPIILAACLMHYGVRQEDNAEAAGLVTPHRDSVAAR